MSGSAWLLNAPSSFSNNDSLASKGFETLHPRTLPTCRSALPEWPQKPHPGKKSLLLDFSLHGEHKSPQLKQEAGNSEAGPLTSCYCPRETPIPAHTNTRTGPRGAWARGQSPGERSEGKGPIVTNMGSAESHIPLSKIKGLGLPCVLVFYILPLSSSFIFTSHRTCQSLHFPICKNGMKISVLYSGCEDSWDKICESGKQLSGAQQKVVPFPLYHIPGRQPLSDSVSSGPYLFYLFLQGWNHLPFM